MSSMPPHVHWEIVHYGDTDDNSFIFLEYAAGGMLLFFHELISLLCDDTDQY